jgi:hypothetical protein
MATTGWLAPWPSSFRPNPGEFAVMFQTLSVSLEGSGPTLVGTNTTNVFVPVPYKNLNVLGASMTGANYTNTTTCTATLNKKSGSTVTALTAAFDLTAAGATPVNTAGTVEIPLTGSVQDCTLAPGDVLYWTFIAAATFLPATAKPQLTVGIGIIS